MKILGSVRSRPRIVGLSLLCIVAMYCMSRTPVKAPNDNTSVSTTTTSRVPSSNHSTSQVQLKIPEPTFEDRLAIGKRFAFKVANSHFLRQSEKEQKRNNQTISLIRLGDSEWRIPETLLTTTNNCLVYSFGVADRDVYTEEMAQRGCQVIAMDPTVKHPTNWMPNVKFYPWGLANRAQTENQPAAKTSWSHPIYGTITGSFYTIPEIVEKLGHAGKTITALKLDCEGCEFAAFQELWQSAITIGISIRQIDVEFHVASTLGMVDKEDIARMYYAHIWLKTNRCQLIRQRRHEGFQHDQDRVPQILVQAGVSSHHCCYEMTYLCGEDMAH